MSRELTIEDATEFQVDGRTRNEYVRIVSQLGYWSWQIVRRDIAFIGQIRHPTACYPSAQAALDAAIEAGAVIA